MYKFVICNLKKKSKVNEKIAELTMITKQMTTYFVNNLIL